MRNSYSPRTKLIKLRTDKGFTQEQMARLLKIKRATYANYETGYRNPSLEIVIELKKILGVTEDKFFLPDKDTKSTTTNLKEAT
ncbi:MAG: helix-turn-helix transcriptional regulator [Clostridia bacterium]|nr:helix-turn-helix transcriptional regulator [Clostridia bacterium]